MVIDKNRTMGNTPIQEAARLLGSIKSAKKARTARENGKKGGRPKKKK